MPRWTRGGVGPRRAVLCSATRDLAPSSTGAVKPHRALQFAGKVGAVVGHAAGVFGGGGCRTIVPSSARKALPPGAVESFLAEQYGCEGGAVIPRCTRLCRGNPGAVIPRGACETLRAVGAVVPDLARGGSGRCLTVPTTGTGQCVFRTDGAVLSGSASHAWPGGAVVPHGTGAGCIQCFTILGSWAVLPQTFPPWTVPVGAPVALAHGFRKSGIPRGARAHRRT